MAYPKITKRKDGRFSAMFSIGKNPKTGKTVRKTVYGKTKTEVKQNLDKMMEGVIKGTILPTSRSNYSLEDWSNEWFLMFSNQLSVNTQNRYKSLLNTYILPYLGNIDLIKLTPVHCQRFLNHLIEDTELSINSVHHVITLLKSILNKAVVLDYLGKNPANNLNLPKKTKPQLQPFTESEAQIFINNCESNTYDNLCKFALFTGLRESEIMALTWDNVEGNKLSVNHQFGRSKSDKTFYPTKNKRKRTVGLNKNALKVLEDQKRIQAHLQLTKGPNYRNSLKLIFTDNSGDRLHRNSVYRHFKKLASTTGRDNVRFHDLRHTYAVFAIKAGIDIKTISDSLGHHSVSFTLDQYAYVTDNMIEESLKKFDSYLDNYSV